MTEPSYRHIQCATEQGVLVITITASHVEGEETSGSLRDELLRAVEASGLKLVVIDFRHTKYISSVAFRPLLSLRRKLKDITGRMMLCGLSPVVGDVFYTTKMVNSSGDLSAPFEMESDVAGAVARLTAVPVPPKDLP